MDRKGYDLIKKAFEPNSDLDFFGIEATISPEPRLDEDCRFVTVTTSPDLPPEAVLNALHGALLLTGFDKYRQAATDEGELPEEAPELHPFAPQPGSITFEDHNRVVNSPLYR